MCLDNTKWRSSSTEKTSDTTSIEAIPGHFPTHTTTTTSHVPPTSTARDEPSNKIPHFPGGSFTRRFTSSFFQVVVFVILNDCLFLVAGISIE